MAGPWWARFEVFVFPARHPIPWTMHWYFFWGLKHDDEVPSPKIASNPRREECLMRTFLSPIRWTERSGYYNVDHCWEWQPLSRQVPQRHFILWGYLLSMESWMGDMIHGWQLIPPIPRDCQGFSLALVDRQNLIYNLQAATCPSLPYK